MAKGKVQVQASNMKNKNKRQKIEKSEEPVSKKVKKIVSQESNTSVLKKQKNTVKVQVQEESKKKVSNKRRRDEEVEEPITKKAKKTTPAVEGNKSDSTPATQQKVTKKNKAKQNGVSVVDLPEKLRETNHKVDNRKIEESQSQTLFVKKIPTDYTTEQVKALSKDIVVARLKTKKWRNGPGGQKFKYRFAFLEFENPAKAKLNQKRLNGKVVDSTTLCVEFVKSKPTSTEVTKKEGKPQSKEGGKAAELTKTKKEVVKAGKKSAEVAKTTKKAAEVVKAVKKADLAKLKKKQDSSDDDEEDEDEEDEEDMDEDDDDDAEDDEEDDDDEDDDDDDDDDDDEDDDDEDDDDDE